MVDETGETNDSSSNSNNDFTRTVRYLREVIESTNWNVVLAGWFSVLHFAWLVGNIIPKKTFPSNEAVALIQWMGNCLGFLLVGKEDAVVTEYPVFMLSLTQFLMACLLLWGVHSKSLRRIDQWLLFTVWSAFLNSLCLFNELPALPDDAWEGCRFASRAILFYTFTSLYVWRFYDFRSALVSSGEVSVMEYKSSICCGCGNKILLKICAAIHVAVFSVLVIVCYSATIVRTSGKHSDDVWCLVISCVGLVVSVLLIMANSRDNQRGIQVWLCFQIGLCSLWYLAMAQRIAVIGHQDVPEMLSHFFWMSPLIAMVWISHVRLQEIQYVPPLTAYIFRERGNNILLTHPTVTVNVS